MMLYKNGGFGVEATAQKDGTVLLEAGTLYGTHANAKTFVDWPLLKLWTCDDRGCVWWRPRSWGRRTVARGLALAIAHADRCERAAEQGRLNLRHATHLIENADAHAEALAEIERELSG
jgi:hypothetical protein